jgi:hypothetical protein
MMNVIAMKAERWTTFLFLKDYNFA